MREQLFAFQSIFLSSANVSFRFRRAPAGASPVGEFWSSANTSLFYFFCVSDVCVCRTGFFGHVIFDIELLSLDNAKIQHSFLVL